MQTPAKLTIGIFLAAGIFSAGYFANRRPVPAASSASTRQVLYYSCPMHPQYKSDHPGDCPSCGMRLVPAYAGEAGPARSGDCRRSRDGAGQCRKAAVDRRSHR